MNFGITAAFACNIAINANEVKKQSNKDKSCMKKLIRNMAVLATGACLMAATAVADPIFLGDYNANPPTIPILGSEEIEMDYLNGLIFDYNSTPPPVPIPYPATTYDKTQWGNNDDTTPEIGNLGDWEYIALKFGNNYTFYYLNGATTFEFTSPGQNGLSHYTLFDAEPTNKTPEAGVTAILLGTALLGLGAVRRRVGLK